MSNYYIDAPTVKFWAEPETLNSLTNCCDPCILLLSFTSPHVQRKQTSFIALFEWVHVEYKVMLMNP